MEIVVAGFPPETTEAELREALEAYGVPVTGVEILASDDPTRYTAKVDVDTDETGRKVLAQKLDGYVWKGSRLRASYFLSRSG